jgi:hypothetical protein
MAQSLGLRSLVPRLFVYYEANMIDPRLNDWWSRKHRTDVFSVGTLFKGAGVSLRVLLRTLIQKDLTWYSLIYGDFNDNVLLLAVDGKTASSFKNRPHPRNGPMQRACDGREAFVEYALSSEIQSALGLTIDGNDFHIENREVIQQQIYIHDDCFFAIEPVDGTQLRELIHGILEQHSFYLGSDVHWDGILDEAAALMKRVENVRIQSDPARQRVILSWIAPGSSLVKRIFRLRRSRCIKSRNGMAEYVD